MNAMEPTVSQYFQTVRSAFGGLELYLDDMSRGQAIKDLTATLIMKYVERLKTSLGCWENKMFPSMKSDFQSFWSVTARNRFSARSGSPSR